jgi:hypothetical protein
MSTDDRPSGFHQVSIGHLVMGLAFLGIVGIWALVQSDTVKGDDVRWLLPIPWVVAGVVGLVATAITGPRRHAVRQTGWVGQPADRPEPLDQTDQTDQTDPTEQSDRTDPEETP